MTIGQKKEKEIILFASTPAKNRVEEGGEGAYVTTVRLAESAAGSAESTAATTSFYIGEVKSDSGRNTNLFR